MMQESIKARRGQDSCPVNPRPHCAGGAGQGLVGLEEKAAGLEAPGDQLKTDARAALKWEMRSSSMMRSFG
jgi:hypothetical protein